MTLDEMIALQPAWVGYWVNWLFIGAFVLPLALLIWKETRITAVVTFVASVMGGAGVFYLYEQMGYVKLLGLPHIIVWVPLSFYLYKQINKPDMPLWPKRIMAVVLVTILISLVFDVADVARYILGERTPFTA